MRFHNNHSRALTCAIGVLLCQTVLADSVEKHADVLEEENQVYWSRLLGGIQSMAPSTAPTVPNRPLQLSLAPSDAPVVASPSPTTGTDPTRPPVTITMERQYFVVSTEPLEENSMASSEITLFIPKWDGDIASAPNDVVCFVGESYMLETNLTSFLLDGGDCTSTNGCGVHVHSGYDCNGTESQGGHWYNDTTLDSDPWTLVGYSATDEDGYAQYATCVHTGFDLVTTPDLLDGRAFVVHANDGSRVSCGTIESAGEDLEPTILEAATLPIPGASATVEGFVNVMEEVQPMIDAVCYQGYATGLEPNVESFLLETGSSQCNVTNGCGSHIHAGTGCATTEEQLGHFYDPEVVPVDPWLLESYHTTDDAGTGAFVGCVITGDEDYFGRAFIVHGTDGSRLSCGTIG
mmetsp:Transcript_13379/g.25166  ORF Transcript_13379/g.25166 Transcript_13379/m.25166 type:complete len:406 (-) Transcript_13379:108-1325(-)